MAKLFVHWPLLHPWIWRFMRRLFGNCVTNFLASSSGNMCPWTCGKWIWDCEGQKSCEVVVVAYLATSKPVSGQRPANLRRVKPIFSPRAVRSRGLDLRTKRICSSNSSPSPGRHPVRTQTSFSSRRWSARYGPWLHIRFASLSPSAWIGAANLKAWNATCS